MLFYESWAEGESRLIDFGILSTTLWQQFILRLFGRRPQAAQIFYAWNINFERSNVSANYLTIRLGLILPHCISCCDRKPAETAKVLTVFFQVLLGASPPEKLHTVQVLITENLTEAQVLY